MRYSFEFKLKCVEMYEGGEFVDTSDAVSTNGFRNNIKQGNHSVNL